MRRLALLLCLAAAPATAATLSGVTLPDTETLDGTPLRLNGIGLRTYSFLRIPIYVAGLYLPTPSENADAILASPGPKLLHLRFIHEVGQGNARHAWREGFDNNCQVPCDVPRDEIERFIAAVPAMHTGEEAELRFQGPRVTITLAGHDMGTVDDPRFTHLILATFIGRAPATPRLKRELLGGHG
jgi:hypothetical protein